METYCLFLDELKANNIYSHFCLGGCIIEDLLYRKTIIPYIQSLKQNVFKNPLKILHESEIGNNNKPFWDGMKKLFTDFDIKTICVGVNDQQFHSIYKNKGCITSSEYYVAMQIVLENFLHFLVEVDGKGSVYIESRGLDEDLRLQQQYDIIRDNGTLFMPSEIFQSKLFTISFPMKADNNIGVQIADFIPNPIARKFGNMNQKPHSLVETIISKAYDGNNNLTERFGIKKIL